MKNIKIRIRQYANNKHADFCVEIWQANNCLFFVDTGEYHFDIDTQEEYVCDFETQFSKCSFLKRHLETIKDLKKIILSNKRIIADLEKVLSEVGPDG